METTIAEAQSGLVDDIFTAPAEAGPIGTIQDAEGRELWLYADGSSTLVEADDLFADVEDSEPVGSFEDSDGRVMCVYADGSYSAERNGEVAAK
ncbi:hypothetical protein ACIPY3_04480 [Paenarthrobacter sp. NPDC089714]|uniref:hypothetical protein n=1 Tax=Paenarthrobacter sp. NPDC089714 TaxID=3364377 RepID=UPI0037FFF08D